MKTIYILRKLLIILILPVAFTACFDREASTPDDINHYVYELMQEYYLWYDKVPDLTESQIKAYTDPSVLLEALKYTEIDSWSYLEEALQTKSAYSDEYYAGYGFIPYIYSDNKLKVSYVYKSSDAWQKGLRRGDIIEKYNGYIVENLSESEYGVLSFYADAQGDVLNMEVRKKDSSLVTMSVTNTIVAMDHILKYDILSVNNQKLGYLAFDQFASFNDDSLVKVINHFHSENVNDLVLDLRYNGGGDVSVMDKLVNSIVPSQFDGEKAYSYKHNNKKSSLDESSFFAVSSNNLNIDRLFVLVSNSSASASELLINSLSPYMDVYTIGQTTHGKPVGMYVFEYEDYQVVPICFSTFNSEGYGGYFDGLEPTKIAVDDVTHELGDPEENKLSYVVQYIKTGSFDKTIALKNAQDLKPLWGKAQKNGMYVKMDTAY